MHNPQHTQELAKQLHHHYATKQFLADADKTPQVQVNQQTDAIDQRFATSRDSESHLDLGDRQIHLTPALANNLHSNA
ncbi:hypothetical protein [Scytonema hofmannii]|nr:hypothetical protein [Scytonema hofmannii]